MSSARRYAEAPVGARHFRALAARHRLGELLGGDEGQALVAEARRTLTEHGVRNHEAMTTLFCPGIHV